MSDVGKAYLSGLTTALEVYAAQLQHLVDLGPRARLTKFRVTERQLVKTYRRVKRMCGQARVTRLEEWVAMLEQGVGRNALHETSASAEGTPSALALVLRTALVARSAVLADFVAIVKEGRVSPDHALPPTLYDFEERVRKTRGKVLLAWLVIIGVTMGFVSSQWVALGAFTLSTFFLFYQRLAQEPKEFAGGNLGLKTVQEAKDALGAIRQHLSVLDALIAEMRDISMSVPSTVEAVLKASEPGYAQVTAAIASASQWSAALIELRNALAIHRRDYSFPASVSSEMRSSDGAALPNKSVQRVGRAFQRK